MTDEPSEGNINDPTKQYVGPQPDPVEGNDDEEPADLGEVDQEGEEN